MNRRIAKFLRKTLHGRRVENRVWIGGDCGSLITYSRYKEERLTEDCFYSGRRRCRFPVNVPVLVAFLCRRRVRENRARLAENSSRLADPLLSLSLFLCDSVATTTCLTTTPRSRRLVAVSVCVWTVARCGAGVVRTRSYINKRSVDAASKEETLAGTPLCRAYPTAVL